MCTFSLVKSEDLLDVLQKALEHRVRLVLFYSSKKKPPVHVPAACAKVSRLCDNLVATTGCDNLENGGQADSRRQWLGPLTTEVSHVASTCKG